MVTPLERAYSAVDMEPYYGPTTPEEKAVPAKTEEEGVKMET